MKQQNISDVFHCIHRYAR